MGLEKVFIIEHCENCQMHQWNTRHDANQYKQHAIGRKSLTSSQGVYASIVTYLFCASRWSHQGALSRLHSYLQSCPKGLGYERHLLPVDSKRG